VNDPPKVSVSALGNSLKGVSSRMIRKKNDPGIGSQLRGGALPKEPSQMPSLQRPFRLIPGLEKTALGSPSYFARSWGGAPIAGGRQDIEQQQTPH
jgi:putative transposase